MGTSSSPVVEAVSPRQALPTTKRLHRSPELKRQMVEETLAPGASVARVAQAHGVNANLLFNWRRQYRQGLLKAGHHATHGLLAVRVAEPATQPTVAETHRPNSGTIQIGLPKRRLRITGAVDPETLRVVLEALRG